MAARLARFCLSLAALSVFGLASAADFTLTVLHNNDIHSHVEPTKLKDATLGGYAQVAGLVKKLRASSPNSLLLNGGDCFQGTIFFNVYEGMTEAAFLNTVGYDAMTLGNHEFDKGTTVLSKFLEQLKFPVLSCNIDVSGEPALEGKVKPRAVVEVGGQKIGLVGATTPDTPNISSPGEKIKWLDLIPSIQAQVDALTSEGVNKIILISHCGYEEEVVMAPKLKGVDVIVGGHSHTLLTTESSPAYLRSSGKYPTVVEGADGKDTLIVQAWEWAKVLGKLDVTFNEAGEVKDWKGEPIPVTADLPADPAMASIVAAFRKPVEALITQKVGESSIELNRGAENLMGGFVADAQLAYVKDKGVVAAFMNPGGVRRNLSAGPLHYGELIEVQPFANTLVILELTGAEIKQAIEDGLNNDRALIPSDGTSYEYTMSAPANGRVKNLVVGGSPVDLAKTYKVVVNSFMAGGGDSLLALKNAKGARIETGFVDIDALVDYVKKQTPIAKVSGGRAKKVGS